MQSLPDENRSDLLRARYVELLRLREHVQRLENLHEQKPAPDGRLQETVDQRHH